jgi:pimeloyl-ACP methyl ester carboxylesterase
VKLWGALHRPNSDLIFAKFPTLIFNHGSEETFGARKKYCDVAKYFVPKGYAVFVPFRRGQGDPDHPEGNRRSSGKYIEDILDDFVNNPNGHNTTCTSRPCYKAHLLKLEADEEVAYAVHYLTVTSDLVIQESDGDYKLAVGGNSYGGAVTVFFNRKDHGHKAVMAFAPAAQNWGEVNFAYAAQAWDLSLDRRSLLGTLLSAANEAKKPAFYLQAKWDYDTRATIDLAYAHVYGSGDPTHGNRFMASIFPYQKFLFENGQVDYQTAHARFAEDTDVWGASVQAFLKSYGVD